MANMNTELQKYYDSRFAMFSQQGWKDLVEDVKTMLHASNTLSGVTQDNLGFKQGEVSIMRWILSLQDTTEAAYRDLTDENT